MRDDRFAAPFYGSALWQRVRKTYALSKGGLCERCLARGIIQPGTQVHHKIHLTPDNLNNPAITINPANLELLCEQCHLDEHSRRSGVRWRVDESGRVTI